MPNVIDDQELFRKKQQELFNLFDRSLLDGSKPYDPDKMSVDILNYMLDQIKRDIAKRLQRIETVCTFRINFSKPDYAVVALQVFYDLFNGIDDEFVNLLTQQSQTDEKKKKSQKNS